ncbi:DeoR/GlpR family DNA-binding transcription regulator [Cohaesibacter intestini]|uniref:DeoR/GlpR family DNA-binding transcription regulator n=1 Tax=Cohaesibacter intestini TaxID=2211145 RepID=UPI000DE97078|nr:DeoR/GlpR family DNA-binding transcription regulator [Cohaesibacter intestini]
MKPRERKDAIAAYVMEQGDVRIDDLVERFDVSRMTILRHVDALAAQGVLRKLHGSVTAQPSSVYESLFAFRQTQNTEEKSALAKVAVEEIEPGQVVFIDESTTASAIAPLLEAKLPVKLVTNSLGLANMAVEIEDVSLLLVGGDYHPTYNAFIGHVCESAIAALRGNLFLCSASAVNEGCAFIQDPQIIRVKQAMFRAAQRRVLMVDSSKFDKVALHHFASLDDFDLVLVDAAVPSATLEALTAMNVPLKQVSKR